MSPYAPHNGRETRGVLAESTSKAVGLSTRTVLGFFLTCALLFLAPLLSVVALGHHVIPGAHPAALFASFYSYWTTLCVYFETNAYLDVIMSPTCDLTVYGVFFTPGRRPGLPLKKELKRLF
ncbi:hypothetical protein B0H14DRAFT_2605932 [Mycena olivaceomarginata]|nr:hypothetical protein B0H14DRAFT_2605932 [Mycena olivaceomarginata]